MSARWVWALLFTLGAQQAAIAQEYAGNWWINPQTRNVEAIGENAALPRAGSSSEGGWVEVGTVEGDRLLAKRTRVRQLRGRNPQVMFLSRIQPQRHTGRQTYNDSYAAECATGRLVRLSDGEIEQDISIPTISGTVGGTLFSWACQ